MWDVPKFATDVPAPKKLYAAFLCAVYCTAQGHEWVFYWSNMGYKQISRGLILTNHCGHFCMIVK